MMRLPYELVVKVIVESDCLTQLLSWRQVCRWTKPVADKVFLSRNYDFSHKPWEPWMGVLDKSERILLLNRNDIQVLRKLRSPCKQLKLAVSAVLSFFPDTVWQEKLDRCKCSPDWFSVHSLLQRQATVKWLCTLSTRSSHDYLRHRELFVKEIWGDDNHGRVFDVLCWSPREQVDSKDPIWFRLYCALLTILRIASRGSSIALQEVESFAKRTTAKRKQETL